MGKPLLLRNVSLFLLGTLLVACLGPATAGLVCMEGAAPNCCYDSSNSRLSAAQEEERLLVGPGCNCCVTVEANRSDLGTSSQKILLDAFVGPAHSPNVVTPSRSSVARPEIRPGGDSRLASLRTVTLLI